MDLSLVMRWDGLLDWATGRVAPAVAAAAEQASGGLGKVRVRWSLCGV